MFFMLIQPFFISTVEVKAVGVVGSNALKSVIIGAQEKAGIQYASKTAKEKAFDAWNMKAYESWLEAERTGKNKELWDEWNKIHSNPEQYIKIEPVPDKPNLGRILLDTTIYGMAIGIGADIAFAIEDARELDAYINALHKFGESKIYEDVYYNRRYGLNVQYTDWEGSPVPRRYADYYIGDRILRFASEFPGLFSQVNIINVEQINSYTFTVKYRYLQYSSDGEQYTGIAFSEFNIWPETVSEFFQRIAPFEIPDYVPYEFKPQPDDVPNIIPNPHLEPLITPYPDLSKIPEVLPPGKIEILVPLDPDDDPFWEGVINEPYDLPIPDPGTDPGTDPGNLPEPEPIPDPFPEPTKEVKPEDLSCERVKRPDFDQLGNAFSNAFPFSLPFDIHRFFKASFENIDDKKPEFELSFLGDGVILTIPNEFDVLVKYLKGFILIMFDISLLYLFARFMRKGTD